MQEAPNSVYGIWEEAPHHIGGVTVTLLGSDYYGRGKNTFWTSCNYTPGQLAKEYAQAGRENPSKVAYQSLQNELRH
ncbi:hypothetical protein, partial [Streptococcus pneumoniae]|uniref:hypothetical protein n=1 Tax=Streptococcus pneumoniae TaxID=1313 RepID=UPI001E557779